MRNDETGVWRMEARTRFARVSRGADANGAGDRVHYDLHTFRVFHPSDLTVLTLSASLVHPFRDRR